MTASLKAGAALRTLRHNRSCPLASQFDASCSGLWRRSFFLQVVWASSSLPTFERTHLSRASVSSNRSPWSLRSRPSALWKAQIKDWKWPRGVWHSSAMGTRSIKHRPKPGYATRRRRSRFRARCGRWMQMAGSFLARTGPISASVLPIATTFRSTARSLTERSKIKEIEALIEIIVL